MSLIVTTYTEDRLESVGRLLESVRRQTLENVQFIFVGEGEPRICKAVTILASSLGLNKFKAIFNTGNPGLSCARNIGISHAMGGILAFVDDDVLLSPDWAERLVDTFARHHSIVGVAGAALPIWEDPAMAWFPEEFHWLISCTGWFEGEPGSPLRNAWGVNMAFRREVFGYAMFDERLGGNLGASDGSKLGLLAEDVVFSLRVREATGNLIVYNPEVKVHHNVYKYRLSPRYIRRRAFWEGYTKVVLEREFGLKMQRDMNPEKQLLKRILFKFLPQTAGQFLQQPLLVARRLAFAVSTLFYLALGYASARFILLGRITRPRFEK